MDVKECALQSERSEQTIRTWIKSKGLKAEKSQLTKKLTIDKKDWGEFCLKHKIRIKELNNDQI